VKGLLLAGGHGTRLRPLTFTGNKHMIPIANKPMLFHGLDHLADAGIKELGIILGPIKEGVKEALRDGSDFGVKITYIEQPEPKGLAHAVMIAEDFLGKDSFIMYLGDNLIKQGVKPLIKTQLNESSDCVICVAHVKNPSQYGIVELTEEGNIERLVEKPKMSKSTLALAGVYLFNRSIFDAVKNINPSWRNELEITDAIQYLLRQGKKISVQKIDGWWKDTGRPQDLLEANQLVLDGIESSLDGVIHSTSKILGRVKVGYNSTIESQTTIKGPCIIGHNCHIASGVYIGPYTSIGNGTRVLSGEIEGSIIMEDSIINCNKRIVDSIIGRGSSLESAGSLKPSGLHFVVGDNTFFMI
jgi:glucose-1-phosphate thymidylyltransferase